MANVSVDGVAASQSQTPENKLIIEGPTPQQVNQTWSGGNKSNSKKMRNSIQTNNARVMADIATNTIIVIGKPAVQAVYEKLIKRLDVRRPQILFEATIVMLDTTDGFSLGVEIANHETFDNGTGKVLNFSSFGLSTVDPKTGSLTIKPGIGFNGTMVSADIADVVIRALESDSKAKVMSRPSVLIDDNATGELVSEKEEPYSSVNASSTVATTSFAGYSSAGTKISITPHISKGEFLKLEYEITLSSFGEKSSDETLPPARQTNSLKSLATIPDGYTIIVGGLTREDNTESVERVPFLGRIPGVEYAFSNRSITKKQSTLFVFIRAVILRDDKFKNLKTISGEVAKRAELNEEFPVSEPKEIK